MFLPFVTKVNTNFNNNNNLPSAKSGSGMVGMFISPPRNLPKTCIPLSWIDLKAGGDEADGELTDIVPIGLLNGVPVKII